MADELPRIEAEAPIDLNALWNQYAAELTAGSGDPASRPDDGFSTEDRIPTPAPAPRPPGRPSAPHQRADDIPAFGESEPRPEDTMESALQRRLADLEARLKQAEHLTRMAQKDQSQAQRRLNALQEARQLEANRVQQLRQQGQLTPEDIFVVGPSKMDNWVEGRLQQAAEEDARAEAQTRSQLDEESRLDREAKAEFKLTALPLAREMYAGGLDPTENARDPLNPEDTVYESILRKALQTPDRVADIALTWQPNLDDQTRQRITDRVYQGAIADATQVIRRLAQAGNANLRQRQQAIRWDRTTTTGPSQGGYREPDVADNPTPQGLADAWQNIPWEGGIPEQYRVRR